MYIFSSENVYIYTTTKKNKKIRGEGRSRATSGLKEGMSMWREKIIVLLKWFRLFIRVFKIIDFIPHERGRYMCTRSGCSNGYYGRPVKSVSIYYLLWWLLHKTGPETKPNLRAAGTSNLYTLPYYNLTGRFPILFISS